MDSNYIYCAYAYIRSHTSETAKAGTPYYIGKGTIKRAFAPHKNVTRPKDKSKIILLETNLSEIGALALERRYIEWYGRKCNNSGILLNKAEGGDGVSGFKLSKETRERMSIARIGKSSWNKGLRYSKEEKAKFGQPGDKNPKAAIIKIYNNENVLMFTFNGYFVKGCKENNLPTSALRISYRSGGKPITKDDFEGWYAIKESGAEG